MDIKAAEEEFFKAACAGDLNTLRHFPELVPALHDGATALHFAAINGHIEAARWLLENGADLEATDEEFEATPVNWAHEKGQDQMVRFLLDQGARIGPHDASGFGRLDVLKQIAEERPEELTIEYEWGTVVHNCCIWGQQAVLDWLIEQGADIRKVSRQGLTPLQICEAQAANGRTHTGIVTERKKAEIEANCSRMAERLRRELQIQ